MVSLLDSAFTQQTQTHRWHHYSARSVSRRQKNIKRLAIEASGANRVAQVGTRRRMGESSFVLSLRRRRDQQASTRQNQTCSLLALSSGSHRRGLRVELSA
jgi:hypothetical protein